MAARRLAADAAVELGAAWRVAGVVARQRLELRREQLERLEQGAGAAGDLAHGLAHGAETPDTGFAGYAAGFMLTTAVFAFIPGPAMLYVAARTLAAELIAIGGSIVSGGTDSHVFLLDLRAKQITGKLAEAVLGRAHLTVNKNAIPNDPEKPFVTSGIRIGAPAMTTRGFGTVEARQIAGLMADVLEAPENEALVARVASEVTALCRRFPVYGPQYRP